MGSPTRRYFLFEGDGGGGSEEEETFSWLSSLVKQLSGLRLKRQRSLKFSEACFPLTFWPQCELPWQLQHIWDTCFGMFETSPAILQLHIYASWNSFPPYKPSKTRRISSQWHWPVPNHTNGELLLLMTYMSTIWMGPRVLNYDL